MRTPYPFCNLILKKLMAKLLVSTQNIGKIFSEKYEKTKRKDLKIQTRKISNKFLTQIYYRKSFLNSCHYQKKKKISFGKDVEKLELLYTISINGAAIMKNSMEVPPPKLKIESPHDLAMLLVGILLSKDQYFIVWRCTTFCFTFISQKNINKTHRY